MFANNQVDAVNAALKGWKRNDQELPGNAPKELRAWVAQHKVIPNWIDMDAARRGFKFVTDNAVVMYSIVGFGELFESLADPLLARAVYQANFDLVNDPGMRLARTLGATWTALDDGNLDPKGALVPVTVKLRLVHSAARHSILAGGAWSNERDHWPISQRLELEELLLLTSWTVDKMAKLGVKVTKADADDVNEAGRLFGYMLGIKKEYLPTNADQARQVITDVQRHYQQPSPEGTYFSAMMTREYGRKLLFPDACNFAMGFSRILLDPGEADMLAIPKSPVWEWLLSTGAPLVFGPAQQALAAFEPLQVLHQQLFGFALNIFTEYANNWRSQELQLPTGMHGPATAPPPPPKASLWCEIPTGSSESGSN
ncbi:oxygenase MpaB family protein [Nocardia sp. CDC153]|uniref:oxygenase MpaB family protein n=1 Tax=Nocardia sp. CDC153 TaxID=3112167 RepID=UPI002DB957C8|nr:oxygenase MpaB family protein [Nocardia sp. CDC153]MEC3954632.1 oxygenase MpaB family protein [Nocardia sp. CDC153]